MLDTIGDVVGGLVELVAAAVHGLLKLVFRMEPGAERPGWVRAIAILLIVVAAGAILSFAFAFFAMAFYVLLAIAAIGAAIAFLGLS
jgi:hypothetical protein